MQRTDIQKRLETVFTESQTQALCGVIWDSYNTLVKASDLSELKAVVQKLAEAQQRTDERMGELTEAQRRTEQRMGELTEAQRRTEQRMEELAAAQQRTDERMGELTEAQRRMAAAQEHADQRMAELTEAQRRTDERMVEMTEEIRHLARGLSETRRDVGGIAHSVGYALENEAYRMLPGFLQRVHGITLTERFIRTEIGGVEVNLFGHGMQNGQPITLVGEVKTRLDDRRRERGTTVFDELDERVHAVRTEMGAERIRIVPVLVTHFATREMQRQASEQGVLVVQTFEW
jgi:hypothetical protein